MSVRLDLKGKIFGRLSVVDFAYIKNQGTFWKVRCICGNKKVVHGVSLVDGSTLSCGCFAKEQTSKSRKTHGLSGGKSVEYKAWTHMKGRCLCKTNHKYPIYGGRGIKVCKRWMKFENFLEDMGTKPTPQHSIDRIDTDGNYLPENCRWATPKEQSRNVRNNIHISTPYGKLVFVEACTQYKINRHSVYYNMKAHNLTHQEAFDKLLVKKGIG